MFPGMGIILVGKKFQFSLQLGWAFLKAVPQAIFNSYSLLVALFHLIPPHVNYTFQQAGFALFEHGFNLTIRLFINLLIETLDTVIYILTSQSVLGSLQDYVNMFIDNELDALRPPPTVKAGEEETALVVADSTNKQPHQQPPVQQAGSFFSAAKLPLHNKEDKWLANFLKTYVEEEPAVNNVNAI